MDTEIELTVEDILKNFNGEWEDLPIHLLKATTAVIMALGQIQPTKESIRVRDEMFTELCETTQKHVERINLLKSVGVFDE